MSKAEVISHPPDTVSVECKSKSMIIVSPEGMREMKLETASVENSFQKFSYEGEQKNGA